MFKKYLMSVQLVCVCALALFAAPALGDDEDPLGVGKAPPALQIVKYVRGDAPDLVKDVGCVVVVFFTLGDAKNSTMLSTLNSLHKELAVKGLQVLLVAKDKPEDISKSFSKAEKNSMTISVGADDSEATWRLWVDAAKQEKVPLGFILSRGKIVWVGNPLDETLPMIVRKAVMGKYDPQLQKKAQPMLDAARKSLKVRNLNEAYKHFDEVIELDPAFFVDVVMERYKATLKNESDPKVPAEWILKMVKKCATVSAQNEIVNAMVLDPEIEKRDLESAELIAESLAAKNPTIGLQAQAMIRAYKKDWAQAIDLQTDAWMGATILDKPMAKQRLDEYRASAKNQNEKKP